jgi:hypothetical protein
MAPSHSIGGRGPWARLLRLRGHLDRPLSAGMEQLQPSLLVRRREHFELASDDSPDASDVMSDAGSPQICISMRVQPSSNR